MGFEDEGNNLCHGRTVSVTTGPGGHANSPHPSSREGHHSTAGWSSTLPPIAFDSARSSRCCSLPGPPELGTVNPDAVQDHGQPAGQSHAIAFFIPRRLAICIAQALSHDHFFERSML